MNPYASEDFNRISLKKEPKPQTPAGEEQMDHPLFEGKKMDISKHELKAFTKAMEHEEFKNIMNDYIKEISDPKNQGEYETYLRQLEEAGDLPKGTKLIKPTACFCIKTISKKMVSEINKTFFDQKTFINVCMHDDIQKPKREYMTNEQGQSGYSWALPYSVSKSRHDQDLKGELVSTYDVVFSTEIGNFLLQSAEFKKFVADTAIDGINRVLAEHKEKCSTDYKIMKNLKCKGGEPGLLQIRVETVNPLLKNLDVDQHETKLQKDITNQADSHKELQAKIDSEAKNAKSKTLDEIDEEEDEEGEKEEPMPKSVVQPKYKIVYSYPVELQQCWEGPATSELLMNKPELKIPNEITVTINVPHVDSMKLANLDINETSLVFEYPNLYYLDLNLKYKCNQAKGHAKFDKSKKTLMIRVPVEGLTEDSQRTFEENFRSYTEKKEKRMRQLLDITESTDGQSEAMLIPELPQSAATAQPDDEDDEDEETNGGDKDEVKRGREQFLKIYKEEEAKKQAVEDAGPKEIKFRQDVSEEDNDTKLKIGSQSDSRPLIQELKSTSAVVEHETNNMTVEEEKPAAQQEVFYAPFDWASAVKVDATFQFFHTKDYVFVNLPMKGYSKLVDVHYALSADELLIEVKEAATQKVHRLCKTLLREVNVELSSVELLIDFIAVKLRKDDKDSTWDQLGYDVKEFTLPRHGGQIKSNFMSRPIVVPVAKEIAAADKENEGDESNNQTQVNTEAAEIDEEAEKEKKVQKVMSRINRQLCFLNLESATQIFKIY